MLKNDPILIFALLYIYLIIFHLCVLDDIHCLYIHLNLRLRLNHLMLNLENVLFFHCSIFAFFLFFFQIFAFLIFHFFHFFQFFHFFLIFAFGNFDIVDFLYFGILLILLKVILFLFLLLILVMFLSGLALKILRNYVSFLVLLLCYHHLMIIFFAFYGNVL